MALDARLEVRTKNALIKLVEENLDRLPVNYEDVWSESLDIELLAAKLYLYGLSFVSISTNDIEQDQNETPGLLSQCFLYRGFAVAVRLLHTVGYLKLAEDSRILEHPRSPMMNPLQESPKRAHYIRQLRFFPKYFFRMVAFANFYLLWFLAVDLGASEADKELARNYVCGTRRSFMSFPDSPEHMRYDNTREVLGRMSSITNGNPASRVTSRLGASFMNDIIRTLVLYREATRHAQDAQFPFPRSRMDYEPLSTDPPELGPNKPHLERAYSAPENGTLEWTLKPSITQHQTWNTTSNLV
ncbi:hypothetical protein MMC34_005410 [Xylographa carneopallida]|nr:hypothetical protein [Xylographa carneopallida]